jgi:hypothetical protein
MWHSSRMRHYGRPRLVAIASVIVPNVAPFCLPFAECGTLTLHDSDHSFYASGNIMTNKGYNCAECGTTLLVSNCAECDTPSSLRGWHGVIVPNVAQLWNQATDDHLCAAIFSIIVPNVARIASTMSAVHQKNVAISSISVPNVVYNCADCGNSLYYCAECGTQAIGSAECGISGQATHWHSHITEIFRMVIASVSQ